MKVPVMHNGGDAYEPLLCPACGSMNLHHRLVTVYERNEDAAQTRETRIAVGSEITTATVPSAQSGNPSSRRDGLAVGFYCEQCPALTELTIEQHKGSTYLAWRRTATILREDLEATEDLGPNVFAFTAK